MFFWKHTAGQFHAQFWVTQRIILIILGLCWQAELARAQEAATRDTTCYPTDLAEIIRKARHKPEASQKKESSLMLMPIIGSNPATGFMVGLGGQLAFKMPESKLYSLLNGSIQATTKNQYIFMLKNNVYTRRERFFHTGDWRFMIYSQPTYGLGTNAPVGGILDYQFSLAGQETETDSLAQPMKFNFLRIHQTLGIRMKEGIYLGLGYLFDGYSKIKDEKLRLNPGDSLITSHYAYNVRYGFDTESYFTSALNVSLIIDTRDNMVMPHRGYYLNLGWRGAFQFIGNTNDVNILQGEWRSFHGVSKKNPAHLIGFWVMGTFTKKGEFPYLTLPATAYDQRSRSARGYAQGRFRGHQLVYSEVEYRFPISKCNKLWSGVLFLNGTTASNEFQNLELFESVKLGYGVGLRLMLDKDSRTNLVIDYGWGERSSGFYLAVSETF